MVSLRPHVSVLKCRLHGEVSAVPVNAPHLSSLLSCTPPVVCPQCPFVFVYRSVTILLYPNQYGTACPPESDLSQVATCVPPGVCVHVCVRALLGRASRTLFPSPLLRSSQYCAKCPAHPLRVISRPCSPYTVCASLGSYSPLTSHCCSAASLVSPSFV